MLFRILLNLVVVFRLILVTDTNMFVRIWAVGDVSVHVKRWREGENE